MGTSAKVRLYLAHPATSRHEIREWELLTERKLGVELANPLYDDYGINAKGVVETAAIDGGSKTTYDESFDPKEIVENDLSLLDECDGMLVVLTGEATIGVWMELFYAKENHIPVLLISEQIEVRGHPFVRYCADKIFNSREAFEEFWRGSRGHVQVRGIGLTGRKRSGKDTVGEYLVSEHNYQRFAFADDVRFLCKRFFGFSREELETKPPHVRQVLQAFGTEYARGVFPTIWIDLVLRRIERYRRVDPEGYRNVVITDVRFRNEVERLRELGFVIAKLERGGGSEDSHASETEVERIIPDFRLDNEDSISDLYTAVDRMLRVLDQKRRYS